MQQPQGTCDRESFQARIDALFARVITTEAFERMHEPRQESRKTPTKTNDCRKARGGEFAT